MSQHVFLNLKRRHWNFVYNLLNLSVDLIQYFSVIDGRQNARAINHPVVLHIFGDNFAVVTAQLC